MSHSDLATLLAEHASCAMTSPNAPDAPFRFACGAEVAPPFEGLAQIERAHLAAAITAAGWVHGPTAQAGAWSEGLQTGIRLPAHLPWPPNPYRAEVGPQDGRR